MNTNPTPINGHRPTPADMPHARRRPRRKVQPEVLRALQGRPGSPVTIDELADQLHLTTQQVSAAASQLTMREGVPVDRVGSGIYRYETPKPDPYEVPVTPKPASKGPLFEQLLDIGDGRLILRDDQQRVYVASLQLIGNTDGGAA